MGFGGSSSPSVPEVQPAPKAATPKPVTEAATAARQNQKDKASKAAGIRASIHTTPLASQENRGKTLLGNRMRPAQRPALRALLGTAHQGPPLPTGDRPEAEERLALRVPALARRYRALLERRSPWDTAWESLAEHFLPTRFRTDDSPDDRPLLNRSLVDATGILAMRTLAAGLQGGMTSPARPWFRLALDDPELSRSHAGQRYLDEVEARMRVVLQRCNFYNAMHTIYAELGTFGTAFVFELADLRHGFRFVPLCAGQYVLDTDAARRVDTVFHRMHMSLRQMVQSFGPKALPENLRLAARRTPDQRHAVIHAVLPRTERRPRLAGQCHMPWASVYWLEGREGQVVPLKESGFLGFPGFGPRWDVAANDVYGRSPAMDALPDCRMLQQMGITTLKAIHKAVDPPMSVHAGLRSVGLDLTPGGINFVDSLPGQNQPVATPLLQVKPDLAQARSAMEAVQQQIRAGLCRAVDGLMTSAEGRDLLRWLLQAGLCFTAACPGPGTPAGQIYWEEGRRHVGVAVLRLLQEADPSHLPRLFLTQEEDDARN